MSAPALVGRAPQLAALVDHLDRARAGRGQVALLEGEGGIGKSRLLAEALAYARDAGLRVFYGRADELEVHRPFGPLVDALGCRGKATGPEHAAIVRLIDSEVSVLASGGGDVSFRVVEALLDLLERTAVSGPFVLAVDDIHWADDQTVRAMRSIGRRLAHLPIALLATLRPAPRSAALARLVDGFASDGALCLGLAPLDAEAVCALVEQATGLPPGRRLLEQIAGASGNPLFVNELVRALADEGSLLVHEGHADVATASLPPTLRLTILRRLSLLPERTIESLRLAAFLGSTFSLSDLSAVSGTPGVQLLPAVEEARRAGILGEIEGRLGFRHELLREAIYQDLPLDVRRRVHLEVGRALSAAGAPAAQVAPHLARGASPGDDEAVGRLWAAAVELRYKGVPAQIVELLQRARQLVPADDPRAAVLDAQLVNPLRVVGRVTEAEALARQALTRGIGPSYEGWLRWQLAFAFLHHGKMAAAHHELRLAVGLEGLHGLDRASLLASAALTGVLAGEVEAAEQLAEEALAIAETLPGSRMVSRSSLAAQAGAEEVGCVAAMALAFVADAHGRVTEAMSHARAAVDIQAAHHDLKHLTTHIYLGVALAEADDLVAADAAFRTGRTRAEENGQAQFILYYQWGLTARWFFTGEWDDAVAEAEAGLAMADEVQSKSAILLPYGMLARIALHRSDLPGAAAAVARGEQELAAEGVQLGADWLMWAKALLFEARGNPDQALALLATVWDRMAPLRYFLSYRAIAPDLVRLALAAGDLQRARAVTAEVEEGARRSGAPSAEGAALRCRGLVEGDTETMLAAVAAYDRSERQVDGALAREDAAGALVTTGRVADAVRFLSEAAAVYETVGAHRDLSRANAALRGVGVRRGRRGPRGRPTVGWESLTGTELEVVHLAADGLTNREIGARLFLSRYTVETHLRHVYDKLGVGSRVELTAELVRRAG